MSLRQDFDDWVSLLSDASVDDVSIRLVGFQNWMNRDPAIKQLLDNIKAQSPLTPIINGGASNRHEIARRSASSREAVATIGLYMVEGCTLPMSGNSHTSLSQIAGMFGLRPIPRTVENMTKEAMKQYIHPFLTYLKRMLPEESTVTKETNMSQPKEFALSIFISHSSKDENLAAALVDLLRSALNISVDKIRCTSVAGYGLAAGAKIEDQLRKEVHQAKAFIGLITPASIESAYVLFELGARWGAKLHFAPLLGAGADSRSLRGPLASLNALTCDKAPSVHQLIQDLATELSVTERTPPAAYHSKLEALVEASKASKPPTPAAPASQIIKLEPDEIKILQMLVEFGEHGIDKNSLSRRLNLHLLKIDRHLDRLVKQDFVHNQSRHGQPTDYYRLAPGGRDFLIENNHLL